MKTFAFFAVLLLSVFAQAKIESVVIVNAKTNYEADSTKSDLFDRSGLRRFQVESTVGGHVRTAISYFDEKNKFVSSRMALGAEGAALRSLIENIMDCRIQISVDTVADEILDIKGLCE